MCFASVQASFIGSVGPIFLKAMIHVELFSNHDSALLLGIHVQYALISMKLRLPAKNPRENALNIIFFLCLSCFLRWLSGLGDYVTSRLSGFQLQLSLVFFMLLLFLFWLFFFISWYVFPLLPLLPLYLSCTRFCDKRIF